MIDWARVSELRDEVGPEDFEEVLHLFLEEVDEEDPCSSDVLNSVSLMFHVWSSCSGLPKRFAATAAEIVAPSIATGAASHRSRQTPWAASRLSH